MDVSGTAQVVKKPRSEKQQAATARALLALAEKRKQRIDEQLETIQKEVAAAEPPKEPEVKVKVKAKAKPRPKRVVVVEESDGSSTEEEIVIRRAKKSYPLAPPKREVPATLTGSALLDKIFFSYQ